MFAESSLHRPINIHEQVLTSWIPQVSGGTHGAGALNVGHTNHGGSRQATQAPGLWDSTGTGSWNDHQFDRKSDRSFGLTGGSGQNSAEFERMKGMQRQSWRLQAIADLAPSLAHEFNNLMMIISARTLLVHASAPSSEKVGIHLQAIDQSAERAREMARCLLSLVRPETADWNTVDLQTLISESATMLRRLLPPEVRVRVDLPRHPVTLHGCGDMLAQAILHAAARAWKQVRDGGELLISLAPPDSGQMSITGGWLRLSLSHEAESSMRRAFVPEGESVHFAAMQSLIGEHGGVVSEHALPGGRRLDFLLPVRTESCRADACRGDFGLSEMGRAEMQLDCDEHATARHTLDRWLLLVSSDTRVQQRVAEALVATGWSLVTVPSLSSPQVRPDFGSMAEQRPSGVIIDLATARPDQLPPQLAHACRDLPCLMVGADRGQAVDSVLPSTFGAYAAGQDDRRGTQNARRGGGQQLPSAAASGGRVKQGHGAGGQGIAKDLHGGSHGAAPAPQHNGCFDHPLDRQVVQRWVDQLTRVNPASASTESPTPNSGTFFGAFR